MLRVGELGREAISALLDRYGLTASWIADDLPITASFWGEPEAGIIGRQLFLRADTPVHSLLHEVCHIICMTDERRSRLDRDAGGDDLEEAAVCYLQIVLADYLAGTSSERLMQDMDSWGYSFRLGSTARWFADDAEDARHWLRSKGLLDTAGGPVFRLRAR